MPAYFLESVDRVMKVLDAFTAETPELRLTDLSERLGIPKPQVLRIVSTLETGGYLVRDPDTKRYRLGIRIFQLGMVVRQGLDLRRVAQPFLQELAAETHETVGLFASDLHGPICIDVIDSPKGLRVFAQLGRRMPWNAGTAAKVILAHLPADQRERILTRGDFKRYTMQTITDSDRLRDVLAEIRRTGYHVGIRDLDNDALGVAAPIFDHDAQIAGAISVGAPVSRTSEQEIGRFLHLVRYAATEVSRQLGHHLPETAIGAIAADD
ncbi:MAG: IclR family transcriptional regulator, regulon repressor [Thermomicrobiales bacterium]|nr:IclR family transcriptional regulator, regulon repressor [Thermomicrobiales bacterium]